MYQDLFGEGIYVGKGIYDIDAFEAAIEHRVPENTLLSHDLFATGPALLHCSPNSRGIARLDTAANVLSTGAIIRGADANRVDVASGQPVSVVPCGSEERVGHLDRDSGDHVDGNEDHLLGDHPQSEPTCSECGRDQEVLSSSSGEVQGGESHELSAEDAKLTKHSPVDHERRNHPAMTHTATARRK